MLIIPLGLNGYMPSFGRQTMSILVKTHGKVVILDAGTGLGRLGEPTLSKVIGNVSDVSIILSHYHLDHVVGLTYLPAFFRCPIRLYTPAPPLVDIGATVALERLLSPPLCPIRIADFPMPVSIAPITDETFSIGTLKVSVSRQPHPGGSIRIRLGNGLAYLTDTEPDRNTLSFVSGVDVLMHEVWWNDLDGAGKRTFSGHSSVSDVADLLREADVQRIVPIHHNPGSSAPELVQLSISLASCGKIIERAEEGAVLSSIFEPD